MEFQCIKNTGRRKEKWIGEIKNIRQKGKNQYEMEVTGRGSYFHLLFGSHAYGNYLCIPSWDFGCELSSFTDMFWNLERISTKIRIVDATTITYALFTFGEYIKKIDKEIKNK